MKIKPGYKQTEVGVIPGEWEVKRLEEVGAWKGGMTPSMQNPAFWVNGNVPWISSGDVKSVQLRTTGYSITAAAVKQGTTTMLPANSIVLVTRSGILRKYLPVAMNVIPMAINQDIKALIPANKFYPTFVLYALIASGDRILARCMKAGTTVESVEFRWLKAFIIPVPPLPEQRAIAEALGDVDALLGGLDRLIAKKRDIKQAAMQQLLTGQTRLPGFHGEWEVKLIGEFTDCTAGGTPSTLVASYWGGSIPWMSSGELKLKRVEEVEGRITDEGLRNSSTKMIQKKCVLIGLAGQGKTRGTVAMNFTELCTNQSIAAIFPSPAFVPEYLYYNIDTRYDELRDLSAGDGGRGGLNLTIIKAISIPLPPLPEQTAIAEVLTDMDTELAGLEQRREKTRALKQAMMQELLTGRTRLTIIP